VCEGLDASIELGESVLRVHARQAHLKTSFVAVGEDLIPHLVIGH